MGHSVAVAFLLSFLAGSATMIGGALAFVIKKKNLALLSLGLGFSAGVMLYVSFMELLPQALANLQKIYGPHAGGWLSTGIFFGGILVAWLIDICLPSHHVELHRRPELTQSSIAPHAVGWCIGSIVPIVVYRPILPPIEHRTVSIKRRSLRHTHTRVHYRGDNNITLTIPPKGMTEGIMHCALRANGMVGRTIH